MPKTKSDHSGNVAAFIMFTAAACSGPIMASTSAQSAGRRGMTRRFLEEPFERNPVLQ